MKKLIILCSKFRLNWQLCFIPSVFSQEETTNGLFMVEFAVKGKEGTDNYNIRGDLS